jgi:hypothetical protein
VTERGGQRLEDTEKRERRKGLPERSQRATEETESWKEKKGRSKRRVGRLGTLTIRGKSWGKAPASEGGRYKWRGI